MVIWIQTLTSIMMRIRVQSSIHVSFGPFHQGYTTLKNEELIHYARHAYQFIKEKLIDREQGGLAGWWILKGI